MVKTAIQQLQVIVELVDELAAKRLNSSFRCSWAYAFLHLKAEVWGGSVAANNLEKRDLD